ncbi:hypothetical protein J6590_073161 [Homalodisca vitripennis]|nr:hypothetical protein J6590_073161 [Homalodisca vitripennis]
MHAINHSDTQKNVMSRIQVRGKKVYEKCFCGGDYVTKVPPNARAILLKPPRRFLNRPRSSDLSALCAFWWISAP